MNKQLLLDRIVVAYEHLYKNRSYHECLHEINKASKLVLQYCDKQFPADLTGPDKSDHWVVTMDVVKTLEEREKCLKKLASWTRLERRNLKNFNRIRHQYEFAELYNQFHMCESYRMMCRESFSDQQYEKVYRVAYSSKHTTVEQIGMYWFNSYETTCSFKTDKLREMLAWETVKTYRNGTELLVHINAHELLVEYMNSALWCFAKRGSYGMWDEYAPKNYVYLLVDLSLPDDHSEKCRVILPCSRVMYNYLNEGVCGLSPGWIRRYRKIDQQKALDHVK